MQQKHLWWEKGIGKCSGLVGACIVLAALVFTACGNDSTTANVQSNEAEPSVGSPEMPGPAMMGEPQVPTPEPGAPVPVAEPAMEPEVAPPQGALDGSPCMDNAECAGGVCWPPEDGYVQGHCTTLGCADGAACTEGASCVFLDREQTMSACLAQCGAGGMCRDGYRCRDFGNVSLCVSDPPEMEQRADGDPCTAREQCAGGSCLSEEDGFPAGHCTTVGCTNRMDCTGENRACLLVGNPNYCIQLCETNTDCREGFICQPVQGGAYCAPSPTAGTEVPQEGDVPFDVQCGPTMTQANAFQGGLDRHSFSFDIPADTTSFMVVPYSAGSQIYPVEINGPNGELNFFGNYNFAQANAGFLINITPTLFPAAPAFADYPTEGTYTMQMASEENICRYVLTKQSPGTEVDLNFYFVGAGGINAANAQNNQGFQRALDRFDEIYEPVDVQTRFIRYQDVNGANATRFRVIRSQEAAFQLVALSEPPGETADDHLSINVFFIDDFAIQGGSVLGISAGLPGAAGFHGGRGSGLVFAASVLRQPELLGQVLAHEVGHYLGLFHTSEQQGQGFDPIDDTPQCPRQQWGNPGNCPDITNLMFPFAGNDHSAISNGQSTIIHANPLVK